MVTITGSDSMDPLPKFNALLAQLLSTSLSVQMVWGSISGSFKSDTMPPAAGHRGDVFSKLCCPGAMPQRWARHSLHTSA